MLALAVELAVFELALVDGAIGLGLLSMPFQSLVHEVALENCPIVPRDGAVVDGFVVVELPLERSKTVPSGVLFLP